MNTSAPKMRSTFAYAFRQSLPVMAGYVVLGIGFGVLLASHGYPWYWATFNSLVVFAGSLQYVEVNLLATGAGLLTTAMMALVVNIRHLFYSLTMLDRYKQTGRKLPFLIFGLSDETFSLVCSADPPAEVDLHWYYLMVTVMDYSYWTIGSTIGAVLGSTLNFNSAGIDFSMTALFIVIFVEQWEKANNHAPALVGILCTVLCRLIFGSSNFLIPSMIAITAILMLMRRRWEAEGGV